MKLRILFTIIGIIVLYSCSSLGGLIGTKHQKRVVKLTTISNQIKIGYETEKAIIYIGKQDVVSLGKELLSSKKYHPRFHKTIIEDLRTNLDTLKEVKNDIIVQHWNAKSSNFNLYDYNFAGYIDQWILQKLILKGKVEVYNKITNSFENRIIYHFIKGNLGGEQCYYEFENGIEFHRRIISLGE